MNLTLLRPSTMLLVVTLLLGACGQAPATPSAGQPQAARQEPPTATVQLPEPATTTAATALPVTSGSADSDGITITVATDEGYDTKFVPAMVEAPANTTVTLIFKNISLLHHNLQFPAPIKAKTKLVVAAGTSDTITFTTPAPGSYKFLCSIHPDHENMVGTLHVK